MFGSTHLLCNGAAVLAEHDALNATAFLLDEGGEGE